MKNLKMINGLNFKAIVASCLVLGVFGVEVSHAGDSTNTANSTARLHVRSQSLLTQKAKICSELGKDREVLYLVSNLFAANPDTDSLVDALFLQGKAYSNLGKYRKSIVSYSKIIQLCGHGINKSLAYSYRADVYEKIGELDQALIDREAVDKRK